MFDELDELDDLDLDTVSTQQPSDDLLSLLDLDDDTDYVSKTEAVKELINEQDPDLVYVSKDGINWEMKYKSQDPKKSDWTGYNEYQWLDAESILGALEKMMKADSSLLNQIVAGIDEY